MSISVHRGRQQTAVDTFPRYRSEPSQLPRVTFSPCEHLHNVRDALDWKPLMSSISSVLDADFSQLDSGHRVGCSMQKFPTNVSPLTTSRNTWLLTVFRLGLLALRANGPKDARSFVDQNLNDVLLRNLPLRLSRFEFLRVGRGSEQALPQVREVSHRSPRLRRQ